MKVILLEDVKSVGNKGEIVEVNESFARNVLLRKKQGVEASSKNLDDLKLQKANDEKVAAENLAAAKELAKKIEAGSVTLKVKVGEGGRLFGAISSKEIADAVKDQLGLEIDKKKVLISAPLKSLGENEVSVKLHTKVTAALKVIVEQL